MSTKAFYSNAIALYDSMSKRQTFSFDPPPVNKGSTYVTRGVWKIQRYGESNKQIRKFEAKGGVRLVSALQSTGKHIDHEHQLHMMTQVIAGEPPSALPVCR